MKSYTLGKIAKHLELELVGDASCVVNGLGTLSNAQPNQIGFLSNPSYIDQLAACQAAQRRCPCAAGAESGPLCPIACGVALNDRAEAVIAGAPQRWDAVAQPLLTLAFAGQAAAALGSSLAMEWDAFQAVCTPDGLVLTDARGLAATRSAVEVRFCDAPPRGSLSPSPDARAVAPEAWEALLRLAHRTYVPATEAARLKGAGAGLLDRD